jgi:diacylglycerol kinase (ATP)
VSGADWLAGRVQSFRDAGRGVAVLLRTQPNARIHLLATLAVAGLALALRLPRSDWALLVLAIALVWCAEAMNTALEALGDRASPEHHPLVGRAKDVAAAGVLLAAVGAACVGLLVLGRPLLALLARLL